MNLHIKDLEDRLLLKESYWIFTDGMNIDCTEIKDILKQPTKKVIHDMELIINDAIENFHVYEDLMETNEGMVLGDVDFVTMALLILGELESIKSLPLLHRVLNQDEEWRDLMLLEEHEEIYYDVIVGICKNQLNELALLINKPSTNRWARSAMSQAIVQLALNHNQYYQEIVGIFTRQAEYYIKKQKELDEDETIHLGFIIWDLIDLGNIESLPLIKMAFGLQLITDDIVGDYEEVEKSIHSERRSGSSTHKKEIMTVLQRHEWFWNNIGKQLGNLAEEFDPIEDNIPAEEAFSSHEVPEIEKPGRNDPCHCGSGKKFKKCCMTIYLYPGSLN